MARQVPTSFYDVIVVGDDLAGLVAAALCARRGMRVLVAETPLTQPEKYVLGPFSLTRAPLVLAGESSPALRRVVGELSLLQALKRRLMPLAPSFQIILPGARIDVGTDTDAFLREVERELPGERTALEQFLTLASGVSRVLEPLLGQDVSLPPEGFWERREISRSEDRLVAGELLPGVPEGHPARALVALPAAFSLGTDPRATSPAAVMRCFDLWRRGALRFEGGRDALRQMLLEKLRTQHTGEVRALLPCGVLTRWGKACGLMVRDGGEQLGAHAILCAQPLAEFGDLFGERRPKRLFQAQRAILPTAYRYVLNLVLAEAGIPEGIAQVAFVVVDPKEPLVGDNAFAVFIGEAHDGRVPVSVVANVLAPGDGENLEDNMAGLRKRLRARLEEVMPFSSQHVLLVHSPHQVRPPEGVEVREKDLPPPIPPEPLWSSSLPSVLGVGAASYDVGLRNVTAACSQNLPGLGLEGDFAAGWCAARRVCGSARKKRDYLKDEVLVG